jgi:Cytochrome c oxidase assembly protein COX16
MSIFSHKPYKTFNTIHRHPSWFGIPFVLLIVAASFGLQNLTQTRYDLQARRVHEVKPTCNIIFEQFAYEINIIGFRRGAAEIEEEPQEN